VLAILAKEVRFNGLPTPSPVKTGKRDLGLVERTEAFVSSLPVQEIGGAVGDAASQMQSHAHQELFFKGPDPVQRSFPSPTTTGISVEPCQAVTVNPLPMRSEIWARPWWLVPIASGAGGPGVPSWFKPETGKSRLVFLVISSLACTFAGEEIETCL